MKKNANAIVLVLVLVFIMVITGCHLAWSRPSSNTSTSTIVHNITDRGLYLPPRSTSNNNTRSKLLKEQAQYLYTTFCVKGEWKLDFSEGVLIDPETGRLCFDVENFIMILYNPATGDLLPVGVYRELNDYKVVKFPKYVEIVSTDPQYANEEPPSSIVSIEKDYTGFYLVLYKAEHCIVNKTKIEK